MNCRTPLLIAPLCLWFYLALTARGDTQALLALQSTPTLQVFIYSFPGLSPGVLQGAETEATRLLRAVPIDWQWVNCTVREIPPSCESRRAPTDLIIRLVRRALPQASARALGIAGSSPEYATAFLFYDRVLALRTQTCWLPAMLGRVLAHEITHLLLTQEEHAGFGLMRGQWSAEDLQQTSAAYLGLSARSIQLMHDEALRRVRLTRDARKQ